MSETGFRNGSLRCIIHFLNVRLPYKARGWYDVLLTHQGTCSINPY